MLALLRVRLPSPLTTLMQKNAYTAPRLEELGDITALTKATFITSPKDSIFFNGINVGSGQGSLDACVSTDPQNPSGNCDVPVN